MLKTFGYAELHCISNFTFLRGASRPEELVARAIELDYRALAITDECSVAGVVCAYRAVENTGLKLIIGSEFRFIDGPDLVLLAMNREGYGELSSLITHGRRAAAKGEYRLTRDDLQERAPRHCLALWLPSQIPDVVDATWLASLFPQRLWIAVELLAGPDDAVRLKELQRVGEVCGLPLVASGDVHMHRRGRRALQDTLTAIRLRTTLSEAGHALHPNGERHLRPREVLAGVYPQALLEETMRIAEQCDFSLSELRYEYPRELTPEGHTPTTWLRVLVEQGARDRWGEEGPGKKIRATIEKELQLIEELEYEAYFLTVYDIVRYARSQKILCQGRGSAANSVVCYCLEITAVDPEHTGLLFERFISRERKEHPDIDVDFEHERREEVIQYVFEKYTRERTAIAATVIRYRNRSAVRDVGKALGFSVEQVDRLAGAVQRFDEPGAMSEQLGEAGFTRSNPRIQRLLTLAGELIGFPRHLSQHVGGFVISRGPLAELVPVENAAMPDRTVIQWEKDDLEYLKLQKVDVLALGMLTAIRKSLDLIRAYRGKSYTMSEILEKEPEEDEVYGMIQKADTVGVFQIESRAQMSMLPRLRPENYYDLVIEIAIVRPGPIQGDMVHPYLRRRSGQEKVEYPGDLKKVLERTLGIPIFQEQVMQIAMVAADFTPDEADGLRRSMAAWKRKGGLEPYKKKLIDGMVRNGYELEFAERIFSQIKGFGDYGFPESHSASFALLAFVSCWLKYHEPAVFTCALLNSQPMGFYQPSQLIQDARRHEVEVRPVDVRYSDWDCTLELVEPGRPALRLGMRLVKGLSEVGAGRLMKARATCVFKDIQDLATRSGFDQRELQALAAAGAFEGFAAHRHRAYWDVSGVEKPLPLLPEPHFSEVDPLLKPPTEGQDVVADYTSTGLTLRKHPLNLLRPRLEKIGVCHSSRELWHLKNGTTGVVAGLVIGRQRPPNAKGVMFLTIEDETGFTNLVIWPDCFEACRRVLLHAHLMVVAGAIQRQDGVLHLVVKEARDYTRLLGDLKVRSRNFH